MAAEESGPLALWGGTQPDKTPANTQDWNKNFHIQTGESRDREKRQESGLQEKKIEKST